MQIGAQRTAVSPDGHHEQRAESPPGTRACSLQCWNCSSISEEADSNRLVLASEEELWVYREMLRNSAHVVLGLCEHAVQSSSNKAGSIGKRQKKSLKPKPELPK